MGYLKGFLFSPKRSMMPVKALSGGERNRVILAKLFTRPANLLVLDEPTNDLDMETLEVLEEKLCAYSGTLIVVSHDRNFLDNVVTSTVVFEEHGRIREYVGGYTDWTRHGQGLAESESPHAAQRARKRQDRSDNPRRGKLSYRDQRELDLLPDEIETLEAELAALQERVGRADFHAQDPATVRAELEALQAAHARLEARVERWSELEALKDSSVSTS